MAGYKPVKLSYDKIEPEGGSDGFLSPIIFLHGMAVSRQNWGSIPQEAANATKRTVYSIDARNHGDSDWSEEFSMDLVAQDLIHFLDSFSIPKAILVGHSMGGIASIKVALREPERVERLVVEDIGVKKIPLEHVRVSGEFIAMILRAIEETSPEMTKEEAEACIQQFVDSNTPEQFKTRTGSDRKQEDFSESLSIKREHGKWLYRTNLRALLEVMKKGQIDPTDLEGTYEGPACFIYGALSYFNIGAEEDQIKVFFPNAEFVSMADASHQVHAAKPKEFTEVLLKFLS